MKELTPLQELINWINSDCTPMDCVLKAKELLEKERKMVIDAVNETIDAYAYFTESTHNSPPMNGQDYFNNKYNTNG